MLREAFYCALCVYLVSYLVSDVHCCSVLYQHLDYLNTIIGGSQPESSLTIL